MVGTGAGAVLVIDTATGEVSWDRHAHPGGVLELACSPAGGMVASCAEDERARIFSLESGELLAELPGGGGWVEHLSWAPDGQKLAAASGKCVNVWSAAGELLLTTEPLPSTVTAIAWGVVARSWRRAAMAGFTSGRSRPAPRRVIWAGRGPSSAWRGARTAR